MDKEKIIEILEDYEFFVDDDYGGHYEHINCSQRALTPLGILAMLDYISNLEQQCKKQKKVIDMFSARLEYFLIGNLKYQSSQEEFIKLLNILKEVSE